MIELEIGRVRELSLNVPLPKDARLQRLCAELLANPSDRRTLARIRHEKVPLISINAL